MSDIRHLPYHPVERILNKTVTKWVTSVNSENLIYSYYQGDCGYHQVVDRFAKGLVTYVPVSTHLCASE